MRMDRDPIDRAPLDRDYNYGGIGTIILYEVLVYTDTIIKTITQYLLECILCTDTIIASNRIRILYERLYSVDWQFNKTTTHMLPIDMLYTIDIASTFGHLYTQLLNEIMYCIDSVVTSKSVYTIPVVVLDEFARHIYTTFNEVGVYFNGRQDIDGVHVFASPKHTTTLTEVLVSTDSAIACVYDQPVFMQNPVQFVWERAKKNITKIIGGLL